VKQGAKRHKRKNNDFPSGQERLVKRMEKILRPQKRVIDKISRYLEDYMRDSDTNRKN
jgi:hypothetical protein